MPGPDGKPVPAIDFISTMDTNRQHELNMWYHTLNCGFRVRASGETDFPCISGQRVGMGRVYVKVDGKLNYEDWCEGIREGRSYVSDGTSHLMEFAAATDRRIAQQVVPVGTNGSEMQARQAGHGSSDGESRRPPGWQDGSDRSDRQRLSRRETRDRRRRLDCRTSRSTCPSSGAVGSRCGSIPSAHTNPVFVIVGDQPIRASRRSAEWCLRGVDQC